MNTRTLQIVGIVALIGVGALIYFFSSKAPVPEEVGEQPVEELAPESEEGATTSPAAAPSAPQTAQPAPAPAPRPAAPAAPTRTIALTQVHAPLGAVSLAKGEMVLVDMDKVDVLLSITAISASSVTVSAKTSGGEVASRTFSGSIALGTDDWINITGTGRGLVIKVDAITGTTATLTLESVVARD